MASFAEKLHPHIQYFILGYMALIVVVLLLGAVLFLRNYFRKRPFDGDPAIESKEIALQIQAEITRLTDLRNRVAPDLANTFSSTGPVVITVAAASTAEQSPPAANAAANPDASHSVKITELENKHKTEVAELQKKMGLLEAELAAAKLAGPPPGSTVGDANQVTVAAAPEEIQKMKQEIEKEKETLTTQVTHLETVISEYKIFEEDFALVKRYKTENDDLKNQITALNSQIQNILSQGGMTANPAPAPQADSAAITTAPKGPAQGFSTPVTTPEGNPIKPADQMSEEDISNLFASFENGETSEASLSPTQPETNPIAPPPTAPTPEVANNTPSASASEIEAFFQEQEASGGTGGDAADALLAELAAAQNQKSQESPPLAQTQATPAPAPQPGFETEKIASEPAIKAQAAADLESLAESAASDDALMEEFQKLLETDKAT
jgi:hypothetical protein